MYGSGIWTSMKYTQILEYCLNRASDGIWYPSTRSLLLSAAINYESSRKLGLHESIKNRLLILDHHIHTTSALLNLNALPQSTTCNSATYTTEVLASSAHPSV